MGYLFQGDQERIAERTVQLLGVSKEFGGVVDCRAAEAFRDRVTTTTAENGGFAFHSVPAGRVILSVRAVGFAPLDLELGYRRGELPLDVGGLELLPGVRIAGEIVDKDGVPIADARVYQLKLEELAPMRGTRPGMEMLAATSDHAGRFETKDFLPGPWLVRVEADGFPPAEFRGRTAGQGSESGYRFSMREGRILTGVVLASPECDRTELRVLANRAQGATGPRAFNAQCDADGRSTFGPIEDGVWTTACELIVRHKGGWVEPMEAQVWGLPGESECTIQLKAPSFLAFGVKDAATGEPLRDPKVSVSHWNGIYGGQSHDVTSAVQSEATPGRYRFRLATSENSTAIAIAAEGTDTLFQRDLELIEGGTRDLGWIALNRLAVQQFSIVRRNDGTPIEGALVRLVPEGRLGAMVPERIERSRGGEVRFHYADSPATGTSSADGQVSLPIRPGEIHWAVVEHEEFVLSPAYRVNGTTMVPLTVELDPGNTVHVIVERFGQPANLVFVMHQFDFADNRRTVLNVPSSGMPGARSDQSGRCIFQHLAPGAHRFVVGDEEIAKEIEVIEDGPTQTLRIEIAK